MTPSASSRFMIRNTVAAWPDESRDRAEPAAHGAISVPREHHDMGRDCSTGRPTSGRRALRARRLFSANRSFRRWRMRSGRTQKTIPMSLGSSPNSSGMRFQEDYFTQLWEDPQHAARLGRARRLWRRQGRQAHVCGTLVGPELQQFLRPRRRGLARPRNDIRLCTPDRRAKMKPPFATAIAAAVAMLPVGAWAAGKVCLNTRRTTTWFLGARHRLAAPMR